MLTDVGKDRDKSHKKDKANKTFDTRNLSIEKLRKETDSIIDRQTEELKNKIRTNIEAMRMSRDKDKKGVNREGTNSQLRNVTPLKSRNKSSLDKAKRDLKTSTKIRREPLSPREEEKDNIKSTIAVSIMLVFTCFREIA